MICKEEILRIQNEFAPRRVPRRDRIFQGSGLNISSFNGDPVYNIGLP